MFANRKCPKCGSEWITVRYDHGDDLLHCSCGCGYVWTEFPADRGGTPSDWRQQQSIIWTADPETVTKPRWNLQEGGLKG